jgi:hypothetical protein
MPFEVADDEVEPVETAVLVGGPLRQHSSLDEVIRFVGSLLEET